GAPLGVFETGDGQMAMVMTSDAQWQALVGLMERPELLARYPDPRSRFEDRDAVNEIVAAWCAPQGTDELVKRCLAIGIPVGPVQSAWSARTDPHLEQRGTLERLRHRDAETPSAYLAPVLPVRLSRNETQLSPAEPLGSSTEAVLREVLGCNDARIEELRAGGAFGKA
ncbi:MAG: CoA transferase, partial [Myxococcota bacterium]